MSTGARDIVICADAQKAALNGAQLFGRVAAQSVYRRGRFNVALSGGSTPRAMHSLLARQRHISDMPWQRTHIFWVDERCLPPDHPESNFGQAQIDFVTRVPLSSNQLHPMPVTLPPQQGSSAYKRELKSYFRPAPGRMPVFDLIFLGIGADGHTASLFPGAPADSVDRRWVIAVKGGNPDVFRLSLNFPVINAARRVVFQVTGEQKSSIVKEVLEGDSPDLPAARIDPRNGRLTWLIDRAAASKLWPGQCPSTRPK